MEAVRQRPFSFTPRGSNKSGTYHSGPDVARTAKKMLPYVPTLAGQDIALYGLLCVSGRISPIPYQNVYTQRQLPIDRASNINSLALVGLGLRGRFPCLGVINLGRQQGEWLALGDRDFLSRKVRQSLPEHT